LAGKGWHTHLLYSHRLAFEVSKRPLGYQLSTQGVQRVVQVLSPRGYALSQHMIEKTPPDLSRYLLCPMPGLVVSLEVAEGQHVEAGQPLAIVEAMKMQNILRAEKKGVVKAIRVQAGASLAVDAVILEFE
jgi:propionyl-CoA carboxylase alpha chain